MQFKASLRQFSKLKEEKLLMNNYLSAKLKAISFFSIVMVIYVHSYNLIIDLKADIASIKWDYNSFIQLFVSEGISRIAVPIFFAISGYLFFINIKNGFIREFLSKYRKRIYTLVLPYLLWSIYGVIFILILQSVTHPKPSSMNDLIINYSITHLLSTIILQPIPYQLWFIRDLVVLVFISPVIYWSIKYSKYFIVLIFFITWLLKFDYVVFSNEALLFFTIGAFLSIKGINLQNLKLKNQYLPFCISWIILIIFKIILIYFGFENNYLITGLHKTGILIGILAIWFLYDHLFENKNVSDTKFYSLFQYTFFLYAFHEPILTNIKRILYIIVGNTELNSLLIFISAPVFTIFIAILCGFCLKRILPNFYYLITGGR